MVRKTTKRKVARKTKKKVARKKVRAGSAAKSKATPEPPPEDGPPPHDSIPFDMEFFRTQFPNLLPSEEKSVSRSFMVTVYLGDGMMHLDVGRIEQLEPNWALFAVYEPEDHRHDGPSRFVFVPYGAIARVEVTGVERRTRAIGFRPAPPRNDAEADARDRGEKERKPRRRRIAARKKAVAKPGKVAKVPKKTGRAAPKKGGRESSAS